MTTIKYYAFNVWVIFAGNEEATPFFDLVACDIEAAKGDIGATYQEEFNVINYTQKDMVKEVKYNF